ncbi:MAG: DUF2800 domain-containing protein [Candidatus Thiodiazotropha sp. (ex Lucinoma aequizonata)]|nr:DUF2800 domain-containing protein [Candidatus Thiodiazotropha sp. (ex Lucinoma aequizonata)]
MNCPGSVFEEARYADHSNEYSIDGTHTHTLLEYCLKNNITDSTSIIATTFNDHAGKFTIDTERAKRVNVALEYVENRKEAYPNLQVSSEERVDPGSMIDRTDIWGRLDIRMTSDDFCEVVDYKDGFVPVLPNNPQNKLYAIGALVSQSARTEEKIIPENIILTIVQPKLALNQMPTIDSYSISTKELIKWMHGDLKNAALAASEPNAFLASGPHCHYCKHGRVCTERAKGHLEKINVRLDKADIFDQSTALSSTQLTDEQIRSVIESTSLIKGFLVDVNKEAELRFQRNDPIKGLKAVYGRGSKSWRNSEEDTAKILKSMGVPRGTFYRSSFVSPSQAINLKWNKRDGSVKTLTNRQLKKLKDDYIECHKGGIVIVPQSDTRKEMLHVEHQPDWMKPPNEKRS